MLTYLKETTFNNFLEYCKENKKGYVEYNYINDSVLKLIYDFCCKKNLRIEGKRCRQYWDVDKECISYISNFLNSPAIESREIHIEDLFHTVWCKTEWAARCLTRYTDGASAVKNEFGNKICKQIKEIVT